MDRGHGASSVAEYFSAVPAAVRPALQTVWNRIRAHVPQAGEHFAYGIPIVDYRGKGLVGVSAAKSHCSLHLMSPPAAKALKDRLTEGRLSGATLQFAPDAPLSEDTIAMVVAYRIAEADALAAEASPRKGSQA